MKRNGSHLRQYLPWLGLLLGVYALAALLLWLARNGGSRPSRPF